MEKEEGEERERKMRKKGISILWEVIKSKMVTHSESNFKLFSLREATRIEPTFPTTSKCSRHRDYNCKKKRRGSNDSNNLTTGKIRMDLLLE